MKALKTLILAVVMVGLSACAYKTSQQGTQKSSGTDSALSVAESDGGSRTSEQVCQSTVILEIQSSNYRGPILIEFRKGARPGSKILKTVKVHTAGVVTLSNVCSGMYFFSFSTPDSPAVSVTRYFDIVSMESQRTTTKITVTYSRTKTKNGQRVQQVGRGEL